MQNARLYGSLIEKKSVQSLYTIRRFPKDKFYHMKYSCIVDYTEKASKVQESNHDYIQLLY